MSELSLPGGSLQSALQAFKGGADSVYVGLKKHSARKEAKNLDFEELAKLKQYAILNNKKIQLAINTLLDDEELEELIPTLKQIELLDIDALIVQDFGLASLIKEKFPSLALHASTQMAVHSLDGILQLRDLGFERVVLARELTLKEIEKLKKATGDIELKVFIHGSLCYGFSGLCFASANLTNRSANKGSCSQICRTYFAKEIEELDCSFPFSMVDLAVKEDISKLVDIGIDAFKVEGRMKSPLYSYYSALYYKKLLNNEEVTKEDYENILAQFSRYSSKGWTFSYQKEKPSDNRNTASLVTLKYPSHVGYEVGTINFVEKTKRETYLEAKIDKPLAVRDGLQIFKERKNNTYQAFPFGLDRLIDKNNKDVFEATKKDELTIVTNTKLNIDYPTQLFCISKSNLNLPLVDENSIKTFKYKLPIKITLNEETISIEALKMPSFITESIKSEYSIKIQKALKKQNLEEIFNSVFLNSSNAYLTLDSLEIENKTNLELEDIFYPSSLIKNIRREFLEEVETIIHKALFKKETEHTSISKIGQKLPDRNLLRDPNNNHFVFINPIRINKELKAKKSLETLLPKVGNYYYLPLAPITFDEKSSKEALTLLVNEFDNIRVGLNNISQLQWAKENPKVECFVDVYLYAANKESSKFFSSRISNLVGAYHWIEKNTLDSSDWTLLTTEANTRLPLFISRSCYRYDALNLGCENCPRKGSWEIYQSKKTYVVDVIDCITYVSEKIVH